MAGTLSINGASVKAPKSFSVTLMDLDGESTRNAAGTLVRDVIRKNMRKIDITWGSLSNTEAQSIIATLKGSFFTVNYPDPETGTQQTRTFYASDRVLPSYSWNTKHQRIMWEGLSVNLIEK